MDPELQQQVQQRLSELPADVQAAIRSSDKDAKLQAIGKKHNLHIDQAGKLEDETLLVMLGFADPGEFAEHLAVELAVAPQESVALATDVANEIFMPIRASMQAWAEDRATQEDARLITETLGKETSSVVMPSSAAPVTPPAPEPSTPTAVPTPPPAPAPVPKPAAVPDLGAAEAMLSEKKVVPSPAAKVDLAQPQQYKADPYREPVE